MKRMIQSLFPHALQQFNLVFTYTSWLKMVIMLHWTHTHTHTHTHTFMPHAQHTLPPLFTGEVEWHPAATSTLPGKGSLALTCLPPATSCDIVCKWISTIPTDRQRANRRQGLGYHFCWSDVKNIITVIIFFFFQRELLCTFLSVYVYREGKGSANISTISYMLSHCMGSGPV